MHNLTYTKLNIVFVAMYVGHETTMIKLSQKKVLHYEKIELLHVGSVY